MKTPVLPAARALASLALSLTLVAAASAQAGAGGTPPSFARDFAAAVPLETLPALDVGALLAEDESEAGKGSPAPWRFGVGHEVAFDLENSGVWEDLASGERVWRLQLTSPGAYSLNLLFDRFALPEGAQLFVHNTEGRVLGAFGASLNQPHGSFSTEPLAGDTLTLEYLEPASAEMGELRVGTVVHAYRNILGNNSQPAGGGAGGVKSGACNININCPLGANWQDEKQSIARLIMGGVLCSGFLVNNTASDGTQYFMTANHCYSGNPATWLFQFNYESPTCNGTSGSPQSVSGAVLRSKSGSGDNCLVEITQAIPPNYDVYFSGWSRENVPSTHSIGIHHPQGDIRKICEDTNNAISSSFGGTATWRVASWEQGVTEGGSSGSPLYDQNSRIVGQLYGGQATCSFLFNDYYGKFGTSWNSGISSWLDPLGTNQMTLDGSYGGPGCGVNVYCTAKTTSNGNTPIISSVGTPSFASQGFSLGSYNGGLSGVNGIHFWSDIGANSMPFNGGFLCLMPPTTRGPVHVYDAFGAINVPITILGSDVGKTRWFQFWFRDAAHPDGTGTGLTDAAEVTFCP